ncbi:MAG: NAD-dependent epimerase/dehydratase family protein [Patescibacteria group bacterium]
MEKEWVGKKVLITGGLGFIGSNLAHRLVLLGAKVSILDSLNPLYGGNLFNIEEIKDKLEIIIDDVRNREILNKLVSGKDFIFDFAAQVRHTDSINTPLEDLEVNCLSKLYLLEACRNFNQAAKIIFSSSRMVYGKTGIESIKENHPTNPVGLYAIHKLTAEKYFLTYFKEFGIRSSILRISNPYGERQQIKHSKYSLPGWFVRLAMEGSAIKIFGDGVQLRDYIYISDVIDAILAVAILPKTDGEIFNCGYGASVQFKNMVEIVINTINKGTVEYVPWPKEYNSVETGNSELDISKLKNITGWKSKVNLEQGIKKTFDYYTKHYKKYV